MCGLLEVRLGLLVALGLLSILAAAVWYVPFKQLRTWNCIIMRNQEVIEQPMTVETLPHRLLEEAQNFIKRYIFFVSNREWHQKHKPESIRCTRTVQVGSTRHKSICGALMGLVFHVAVCSRTSLEVFGPQRMSYIRDKNFSPSGMSIVHSSSSSHWPISTRRSSKRPPLLAKVAMVATVIT